ncbi:PD-(D/E)XK nuclease family protein [Cellulomonas sp. ATA003]|uniref:RecB family exonuclease n=1 Tax=Cellulomonas sp. ATA003 TaxID=3073064 RepID=UPI002872D807|nr:PD-(D/E)XK nuclease family protein [Cellulomonas sp. ATA003]WNB86845.1 PD-(D/E)XK nuclease family protein [Cellulomonas sp. ATA003]
MSSSTLISPTAPSTAVAPVGDAVVPAPVDRPRRPGLSPSRANDYMQCPLLFRFRVVDKLPEPASEAAARGTLVHAVLERLYDAPAGERTVEAARAMLPAEWDRLRETEPRLAELFTSSDQVSAWLAGAGDLLGTYFTLENPTRLEPHERELFIESQLDDGPLLRGIVDRLDVAPNGAVRVVDYKTGRSPRAGYEGNALFQMRFYALVLWRSTGEVPRMLQLVYLGDGQVLRHEPGEAELVTTERRVRWLWESIQRTARSGEWKPRTSALCGWCAHQSLCPAFGGTPPPVPAGAVEVALGVRPDDEPDRDVAAPVSTPA